MLVCAFRLSDARHERPISMQLICVVYVRDPIIGKRYAINLPREITANLSVRTLLRPFCRARAFGVRGGEFGAHAH